MPRPSDRVPSWLETMAEKPDLLERLHGDPETREVVKQADTRRGYLHWTRFRHRPRPADLTAEEAWALVKLERMSASRVLPLLASPEQAVRVVVTDPLRAALRRIDLHQELMEAGLPGGNGPEAETYSRRAFIEEAFSSSRIEGADTARGVAKEMLRTGREARNRSEQMILNNFRALLTMDDWAEEALTPDLLCQIQEIVTQDTLDSPADGGEVRQDDEVRVIDRLSGEVVHVPPPFEQLPARLERLCAFANQDDDDDDFLHPVVRAILLHYQIAYDHPFGDGNGRTARWVFLWSLIRRPEYWWVRFLPVSRMIDRVRASYYSAFRFAATDGFDATYLVRHQVRCMEQEMEHFARFLRRRMELRERSRRRLRLDDRLNVRQLALFDFLSRHPEAVFTQGDHARFHGVTLVTAGRDLNELVGLGLLNRVRKRVIQYHPTAKFRRLVAE